jgi:hypothetical protein
MYKECEKSSEVAQRERSKPSLNVPVLIVPVFTRKNHWNALIRDARGGKIDEARWFYFDTIASNERAAKIQKAIMGTELWRNGMQWDVVATPQQAPGRVDCGALTCAIFVAYIRWSANLTFERLGRGRLQLTTNRDPVNLGKDARHFINEAAVLAKLLTIESRHPALAGFRFGIRKVTGNKDQQLPNKRPRARDYFNLDKRWE